MEDDQVSAHAAAVLPPALCQESAGLRSCSAYTALTCNNSQMRAAEATCKHLSSWLSHTKHAHCVRHTMILPTCVEQGFAADITSRLQTICAQVCRARLAATPLATVPAAWHCKPLRQLRVVGPSGHVHSCLLPLLDTCNSFYMCRLSHTILQFCSAILLAKQRCLGDLSTALHASCPV